MPPTSSTDSIYDAMDYEEYEFYEDWAAFVRLHDFNIDTYYNLKDKLLSGSLVDYAAYLGIKAVQVNLFDFIPDDDDILELCSMHFPVFHWAAEHAGYSVLKIQHLNTEEKSCEGSEEYVCSEIDSYSYFSFSFYIDNAGLVNSPFGTFNFTLEYEPTSEYEFTSMKLRHTYKTLRDSSLEEITNDLGAQLHNEPGLASITYENYDFSPRKRYEITVFIERTRPYNAVSQIDLHFSASFTFNPAISDEDLLLIINQVSGKLIAEPDITDHSELIIFDEYSDSDYDGPSTDPDESSSEDLEDMKDHSEHDDDDEKEGKRKVVLGIVITVIIIVGFIIIAFFIYVCKKKKQPPSSLGSNNPVYLTPQELPKFSAMQQIVFNSDEALGSQERLGPVSEPRGFGALEQETPSRI